MSFTLIATKSLPNINSMGYVYTHDKTKATVMYVANDDDNKVFSIAFATPPQNNNGIAHILEHSVLCGSKKFPTKEPFVELAKGSLNTFLNAFTSAEHTTYPVASKNQKDFNNLMDVYLDAVFFPNLVDNPYILAQEGWHYHLENAEDDLIYKGVVYNEMKGAYSNPNTVIYQASKKALFPDTIYANESGGHPLDIPTLTQEEFVAFHEKYYHPTNAFTFFYGDLNITEQLERLDVYFNQFEYRPFDNEIALQPKFEKRHDVTISYSISQDESTDYKTFLSLEFVIGESTNSQDYVNYSVLNDILLGNNASPLWKALIESGIASDVDGGFNNSMRQSTFDITLSNSELEHKETFINLVFDTLRGVVANGIDPVQFQAAINKNKFALKEASMNGSFPKGVVYGMSAASQWLFNGNLFDPFFIEDALTHLEKHPELLIDCIEKGFLNNTHAIFLAGVPEAGLNDRLFNDVHDTLQRYKATLTIEEINTLVEQTQLLLERQNNPDTPENLATIPTLTLSDLNEKADDIFLQVNTHHKTTYLHHDTFTSGIDYVTFYFDTRVIDTKHLPYVSLYAKLVGAFPTERYQLEELAALEDLHTGGIHTSTNVFVKSTREHDFAPKFVVKVKVLDDQLPWVNTLLSELLLKTQFDDRAKMKEQLLKIKSRHESKFIYESHVVATHRLRSYYSTAAQYEEVLSGIDFYYFVSDLLENFDTVYPDIIAALKVIQTTLFNQNHLTVGFIGKMDDTQSQWETLKSFIHTLPSELLMPQPFHYTKISTKEAFVLAQDVQYVAQGYNYTLDHLVYNSQLRVLKTILSYTYLWNTIRVQGGAYGAFNVQTRDGDFIFCSYRDPNIAETLAHYGKASDFVQHLDIDERELVKAIIGTFSELDQPLSPKEKGEVAFMRYFLGTDFETLQNERSNILHTRLDDLRQLAQYVSTAMSKPTYCVIGNKQVIDANHNLFDRITTLIK
ncbi:insulinase family protein [Carnobacteriaceae bacterium zg-C25]|nr:insulinase family protein [Carnobacteriaceae bacterium zg-C25]